MKYVEIFWQKNSLPGVLKLKQNRAIDIFPQKTSSCVVKKTFWFQAFQRFPPNSLSSLVTFQKSFSQSGDRFIHLSINMGTTKPCYFVFHILPKPPTLKSKLLLSRLNHWNWPNFVQKKNNNKTFDYQERAWFCFSCCTKSYFHISFISSLCFFMISYN